MTIILALVSTGFARYFVYAGFQLNHKYIAETLCINKNKPWLHCNGRCYFMKKIKQAEEEDRKQNAKDNLNRLEISFFQQINNFGFIEPKVIADKGDNFPSYAYGYISHHLDAIFRPPKLTV